MDAIAFVAYRENTTSENLARMARNGKLFNNLGRIAVSKGESKYEKIKTTMEDFQKAKQPLDDDYQLTCIEVRNPNQQS